MTVFACGYLNVSNDQVQFTAKKRKLNIWFVTFNSVLRVVTLGVAEW